MEQVVRLAGGFVRIRLISHTPERFLKLCANHGISFRHLVYHNGSYEMEIRKERLFLLGFSVV